MKQFEGHRSVEEIRPLAAAAGLALNTARYEEGSDFVSLTPIAKDSKLFVMYSSFNGQFFGNAPDGTQFSYEDTKLDGTPWFDQLLDLFYVPLKDPK